MRGRGKLGDVHEVAVDPEADAGHALARFDMDVAGTLQVCLLHKHAHKAHDRGAPHPALDLGKILAGKLFKALRHLAFTADVLGNFVHLVQRVKTLDRALDFMLGREGSLDPAALDEAQLVDRVVIKRVGSRDLKDVSLQFHRQHGIFPRQPFRHLADDFVWDIDMLQMDSGNVQALL